MPLTDTKVKNAKPSEKAVKLTDGIDAESSRTKACNLLAAGLAVTACGGEVVKHPPMKQEL
nr:hypothetical protein [Cedecea colo]